MSVSGRAIRQTAWVAAGAYAKMVLNFFFNIILMRMIAPEHFGVVAMGMFFLTFGRKLFGFGFNHALIHRQKNLETAVPTHLVLNLVTGLLTVALALIFRPLIQSHYNEATADALVALTVFGLLECAGHTPRIRLEKELTFTGLVGLDLFNMVASNLVAIALAFAGLGWWALVGKQAAAWFIETAGAWRLAPPMPGRRPSLDMSVWYLTFGRSLWIAGMATLISLELDNFCVGSLATPEALGFYSRAFALASLPTAMVTHIVTRVAFPLYARYQENGEKLATAFSQVLRFIVNTTAPMGILMAITASEFVPLLFGRAWIPMIPLLILLVLYACLRPIYDDCGQLFTAIGKPEISSRILMRQAAVVIVACPLLTWGFGARGAAVAVGLALLAAVVEAYKKVPLYVNLSPWRIFRAPIFAVIFSTLGAYGGVLMIRPRGLWTVLFIKSLVFIVLYAAAMAALQGPLILKDYRLVKQELLRK